MLIIIIVLSTYKENFTMENSKLYLGTPLDRKKYIILPLERIPQQYLQNYLLQNNHPK